MRPTQQVGSLLLGEKGVIFSCWVLFGRQAPEQVLSLM